MHLYCARHVQSMLLSVKNWLQVAPNINTLKGTVFAVIRFLSFFLIVIKNCYGIRNHVWKFQISTMKIVPVAHIWSLCVIRIIMT